MQTTTVPHDTQELPTRRRRWLAVLVAAVAFAGAAVGAVTLVDGCPFCPEHVEAAQIEGPAPDTLLVDADLGVTARIPGDWQEVRAPEGVAFFDPGSSPDGSLHRAEVGMELALEERPPGELTGWISERRAGEFDGYRLIELEHSALDTSFAVLHVYEVVYEGVPLRVEEYVLRRGEDRALRVSLFTSTIRARTAEPVLQDILAGLRVD